MKAFENELRKLGFSDKEARVYLSALNIGAVPVQDISKKAGVNRATTYVMIESLMERGLMGSIQKGKKRLYVAEPPDNILTLLRREREDLEEKEKSVKNILDDLRKMASSHVHPRVTFFEGEAGIERLREEIKKTRIKEILEFSALDDAYKHFPPHDEDHRQYFRKNHKIKLIYASESGINLPKIESGVERRRISYKKYPFSGDVAIYGNNVAILNYSPKLISVLIESEGISATFRQMFNLAWETADK